MILDNNAINSLHPNLALGHKDWISRFTATPQADQAKENEQMADFLGLLPINDPCDESKMVALINNKETTIFLGLDSSGKNIILLRNLEVVPSSRLQKNPIIRALHGFGYPANIVTLNYDTKMMQLFSSNCASLTNIRKFVGYDKFTKSTPRTEKSQVKSRAIITLPPFIFSKLMNLPDLSVDHILLTVLQTVANYDCKKHQKITIVLTNDDESANDRVLTDK
jgi:hypothetical protein